VWKLGNSFLRRDQEVGRYDEILMIDNLFACVIQLII
jgi:hypothetical protein